MAHCCLKPAFLSAPWALASLSVNPTMLEVYDEIPKDLLVLVENVILDRKDDATERLLDYSEKVKSVKKEKVKGSYHCT